MSLDPGRMSTDDLVAAALAEVRDDDGPARYLVELQNRPTEEVLELALRLSRSEEPDEWALGVEVLRELGECGSGGRRPFSDRVVPHLLELLRAETVPRRERALLQALAFNGALEARREFTARAVHADPGVRETVAFQLPYVVGRAAGEPDVADAVDLLCHDAEADVRYYALFAVTEEGLRIDPARRARILADLADDPDDQVRDLARAAGQAAETRP